MRLPWIQGEVGLSGDAEAETTRPAGAPYPMPPIPQFRQGAAIAKGFAALGIQSFPQPLAINTTEYKGRSKCLYDGWCDAGCPIGALVNPLAIYIPVARAAGAEFRSYSTVISIVTDAKGESAKGVTYRDEQGDLHFQPSSVIILASFVYETPRLLLNSATSRHPAGLANSSDLVGRYIMTHPSYYLYTLLSEETQPWEGVTGGSLASQDGYNPKRKSDAFGSYSLVGGGNAVKPNDLIGIANVRPDLFGAALDEFMRTASQHLATLITLTESRPLPQNRITLSGQKDEFGAPLAVLTYEYDPDALKINEQAATTVENVFKAAGGSAVYRSPLVGQHLMGGAIMSTDPAKSVTDSYGRTHDIPNLFIAGPSLFPTSGGVNPTFTIHALALRAAEHMLSQWSSLVA